MRDGVEAEAADTEGDGKSVVDCFITGRTLLSLDNQFSELGLKRLGVTDDKARIAIFERYRERILEIVNAKYRDKKFEADESIHVLDSDL